VNVIHLHEIRRDVAKLPEPVPHILLTTEAFLVNRGTAFEPEYKEVRQPVVELAFRYGEILVPANEERDRDLFDEDECYTDVDDTPLPPSSAFGVERNLMAETRARRVLESFGAVEIDCLEDHVPDFGSRADYVIKVDGDLHAFCVFSAYAIPQLKKLGWHVDVDPNYPYQAIAGSGALYANVTPDDDRPDWFGLELGIEVNGKRISLLPPLLDLLDQCPDSTSFESLLSRSGKGVALSAGDGRYVVLPPERLRGVVEILRELYDGRAANDQLGTDENGEPVLGVFRGQVGAIADLDEVLAAQGSGVTEELGLRAQGRRIANAPREQVTIAKGIQATLRSYQEEGVRWMQSLRSLGFGGVLADDMGLGKTLQTITHLLTEKESGRQLKPSLVIAPTSLVNNWQREIAKFAPTMKVLVLHGAARAKSMDQIPHADIVITTYPLVIRDEEKLLEHDYHVLVLDEAQAIKNPRSLAHRTVRKLSAVQRICLSGTPLENNLGEVWALFDFLMPGLLGSAQSYRTRFRHPIEMEGNQERLNLLRNRVGPFILRRLKNQVASELPPKTELVRPVELDQTQKELYESIRVAAHAEVRRVIKKKGLAASTVTVLDALMKLRQVCCDPRLVTVPSAGRVKSSAKYDALMELVTSQVREGRRILIFSQFTSMLALISKGLVERDIRHVSLTGSTPNRGKVCDDFQNGEADVFLISLKAGGTGLNLTRADTVIHYDPWWNPAAQAQATDRAYRIGQTRPVFVYNLIVAGSVEERMLALQQRKRELASAILGGADQAAAKLNIEDLDDLFAPLDD
jgi:superfamily II DNA or RNA helicase